MDENGTELPGPRDKEGQRGLQLSDAQVSDEEEEEGEEAEEVQNTQDGDREDTEVQEGTGSQDDLAETQDDSHVVGHTVQFAIGSAE